MTVVLARAWEKVRSGVGDCRRWSAVVGDCRRFSDFFCAEVKFAACAAVREIIIFSSEEKCRGMYSHHVRTLIISSE